MGGRQHKLKQGKLFEDEKNLVLLANMAKH